MKRQQAAEDAIALSMAKVTTGAKLNRLPPGKIFGMTVTEPDTCSKVTVDSTNSAVNSELKSDPQKDHDNTTKNTCSKVSSKTFKVIISLDFL